MFLSLSVMNLSLCDIFLQRSNTLCYVCASGFQDKQSNCLEMSTLTKTTSMLWMLKINNLVWHCRVCGTNSMCPLVTDYGDPSHFVCGMRQKCQFIIPIVPKARCIT